MRPALHRSRSLAVHAAALGAIAGLYDARGGWMAGLALLVWLMGLLAVELVRAWRDSRDWDDRP